MTPLKPQGAFLTEAYFGDQLMYDDLQLKNNYQTEQQKQFSNTINSGFQPSEILKQMQQSHQGTPSENNAKVGVGLKERVHSRKESTEFLIRKSSISNRGSRPSSSQQIQQQETQDFNNDLSEQLLQQQQLQQEKNQILKDQQKHREDRWRQLTDEEQITQLEDVVTTQQQTIRENKRDLGLIESDLNRIHRKTLIENQATYSIVLDQIMEFEKSFKRMVNDDKQQKAFIQVQINSMHKEKKMLEYQVGQINSRAQWCQDEIGYDDD
eukprot:403347028